MKNPGEVAATAAALGEAVGVSELEQRGHFGTSVPHVLDYLLTLAQNHLNN